jgi:hypothetical protein
MYKKKEKSLSDGECTHYDVGTAQRKTLHGHADSRPPLYVWFLKSVCQTVMYLQTVVRLFAQYELGAPQRKPFPGHAGSPPRAPLNVWFLKIVCQTVIY